MGRCGYRVCPVLPSSLLLFTWVVAEQLASLAAASDHQLPPPATPAAAGAAYVQLPGDITLGGLFPMHEHEQGSGGRAGCGLIKQEKGIQRMEAMLWAVDEINRSDQLLPGISIGVRILDTCSSGTYALEQAMDFIKSNMNQGTSQSYSMCDANATQSDPVSGVIGAAFSDVSVNVARILRLFKIPQVSYASTSTELSDKSRFEYFSRVVPPDNLQAQAMVQVLDELGWLYVSTVAVRGDYGEKGIAAFTALASGRGICVAVSEIIERNAGIDDFDVTIRRLAGRSAARAVIMFVDEDNIRKLLAAAVRANIHEHFQWVASDSWGAKWHPVRHQEDVALGAITILPQRGLISDFDSYFKSLRPWMSETDCIESADSKEMDTSESSQGTMVNCRNVWFREFWSQAFNCSFHGDPDSHTLCTGQEQLSNKYQQEGLVPFVVDAVYAFAHALHEMLEQLCGSVHMCRAVQPVPSGQHLLMFLRNVSFVGKQDRQVRFDKNGDATGFYNIYQFQKRHNQFDYYKIGEWIEGRSVLRLSMMQWGAGTKQAPTSICSDKCPVGTIRNYQDACCWSCVHCLEGDRIDNDTCVQCDMGYLPTTNYSACYRLQAEFMSWTSPWAIVPLVFSTLGIAATVATAAVFVRFNSTPVIKASGRELSFVLLFGIIICYSMTFFVLMKPSVLSCATSRIGLGLCLNICYSALLTKTNRISRIFNMGRKSIQRPSYTSPRSQIFVCIGMISIQLLGIVVWLILEPPSTREVYPNRHTVVLTCGISSWAQLVSLGYNMVLITMCTWYAFKTRKIPANFNEAKYIGFTMYSTCIVWLAFVPIYVTTQKDFKVQLASLCICISISATVTLLCLFTPKVYIVLFNPSKNTRLSSNAHNQNSGVTNNLRFTRSRTTQPTPAAAVLPSLQVPLQASRPEHPPTQQKPHRSHLLPACREATHEVTAAVSVPSDSEGPKHAAVDDHAAGRQQTELVLSPSMPLTEVMVLDSEDSGSWHQAAGKLAFIPDMSAASTSVKETATDATVQHLSRSLDELELATTLKLNAGMFFSDSHLLQVIQHDEIWI